MKSIILVAGLLLATQAFADDLPTPDRAECQQWCKPYWKSMPKLEYVFMAAQAVDMLTTLDIKNHPNLRETNIILGEHPSDGKIIGWFALTTLAHSAITYELVDNDVPKSIVRAWEYVSIGYESYYGIHNLHLGLHFAL